MAHSAKDISHWFTNLYGAEAPIPQRPPLDGDVEVDVAIVGAGYTGLWTAYSLLRDSPELKVAVLEAKFAGYGPSGRNGGAAIAQINGSRAFWDRKGGPGSALALERAVQEGVDNIGDFLDREGVDAKFKKAGVLMLSRTPLEDAAARASVAADRRAGFSSDDVRYLEQAEVEQRIQAAGVIGAKYNAHSASVDPARLVQGLASAVERRGGVIYEQTRVIAIEPHRAVTAHGTVRGKYVIRATEAYSGWLKGHRRTIVPVHTTMIATEPIPDDRWAQIGWDARETVLAEHPFLHLQRTLDNRITIGAMTHACRIASGPPPPPMTSRPSTCSSTTTASW